VSKKIIEKIPCIDCILFAICKHKHDHLIHKVRYCNSTFISLFLVDCELIFNWYKNNNHDYNETIKIFYDTYPHLYPKENV
jgi:hypothetical protein